MTLDDAQHELAALADDKTGASNARRGEGHSVNLSKLRALAKRIKKNPALALQLWASADVNARLLAILLLKPKALAPEALEQMLREIQYPQVHAWFMNYVVKGTRHTETLRLRWKDDPNPEVRRAGWTLTADRVAKDPEGLDLVGLLDEIEAEMKDAHPRPQWAMNHCLAELGIHHPDLRDRALAVGERLEVLKDYPTSKGCTSPFAPLWIAEMVRRQDITK